MRDIAGFLGSHPPFDSVGADDLAHIAAATETEFSQAGKTIFSQGAGPVEYLRVVRTGSVEIIHDGRVLDLLGPGELFGHASMISGLPTGFEARAAEDTLCCRIPAEVMRPLEARNPFLLRRAIDLAASTADLAAASAGLGPMVVALHLTSRNRSRAVASVQSSLAAELSRGIRWG